MISHLLFIDDIWVSIYGSLRDMSSLKKTLDLFCKATGMKINLEKSCLLTSLCSGAKVTSFLRLLPVQYKSLEEGVKYLGFHLKPDKYKKSDWAWLIRKVEVRIDSWVFRTLVPRRQTSLTKVCSGRNSSILELNSSHSQRNLGQDKKISVVIFYGPTTMLQGGYI
jgi:hypothetical protein